MEFIFFPLNIGFNYTFFDCHEILVLQDFTTLYLDFIIRGRLDRLKEENVYKYI